MASPIELIIIVLLLGLPYLGYILLKKKGNLFAQIIGGTLTVISVILLFNIVILGMFF